MYFYFKINNCGFIYRRFIVSQKFFFLKFLEVLFLKNIRLYFLPNKNLYLLLIWSESQIFHSMNRGYLRSFIKSCSSFHKSSKSLHVLAATLNCINWVIQHFHRIVYSNENPIYTSNWNQSHTWSWLHPMMLSCLLTVLMPHIKYEYIKIKKRFSLEKIWLQITSKHYP